MKPEIVPTHERESLGENGMLFVRTDGILETMVKAHLMLAGLIIVALMVPMQVSFSSTRTLDLFIQPDGSTHVTSEIDVDPSSFNFELDFFGPSVDNFVAFEVASGSLLSVDIVKDKAVIDILGSSSIVVDYDIHDLISKEGRVWTFSFDSPSSYSLLMPKNSVIIEMGVLPNNMEQIDEQVKLELSAGHTQIDYIFGITPETPATNQPEHTPDFITLGIIIGSIITASVLVVLVRRKQSTSSQAHVAETSEQSETKSPDTIFNLRPTMREDDKEIVKFIFDNGGKVFESDLRKKFLQPRTTMWRAVKRLERLDIVKVYKKDMQNMVKLRDDPEEES